MAGVLVIDRRPEDKELYCSLLSGYECVFCTEGEAALRLLSDGKGALQACLVLWELEGQLTGCEIVARLAREHPELPIIAVSGLMTLSAAEGAINLGATDFLLKPLDAQRLRNAVAKALGGPAQPRLLAQLRQCLPGKSRLLISSLTLAARAIEKSRLTVLVLGESGTGKELVARAIHELNPTQCGPWHAVNMAVIPASFMESTLFGHERGAFTGAHCRRVGAFEECGNGTLFLDEIGELDLALQSKLLRVIQEQLFRTLGGQKDIPLKARLVLATNKDLEREVREGRFREDLYQRIAKFEIKLPSLRDRKEDFDLLVNHFLRKHGGQSPTVLAKETKQLLESYSFPGNIRELENILERALLLAEGQEILPSDLPLQVMRQRQQKPPTSEGPAGINFPQELFSLKYKDAVARLEQLFNEVYTRKKVEEANGKLGIAAEHAGLDPKTFRTKSRHTKPPASTV
jgi:two-component system response regulator AtoC